MNCVICNTELNIKKRQKKFCSFRCRDKSYEKISIFHCKQCLGEFSGTARKVQKSRKFCSQICVNEWKQLEYLGKVRVPYVNLQCEVCKKEFTRMPSKIHGEMAFCSLSCSEMHKVQKMRKAPRKYSFLVYLKNSNTIKVRSRWEALFIIEHLEKNNVEWQYEPKTFLLENGCEYTPDFYLPKLNQWIEVKGYDYEYQKYNRELFSKSHRKFSFG